MSKEDKKGIEIPGLSGKWEQYGTQHVMRWHVKDVEPRVDLSLVGEGAYVIFRRVTRLLPCQVVQVGDGVLWEGFEGTLEGVVTRTELPMVVYDVLGTQRYVHDEDVVLLRRNGKLVWHKDGI